MSNSNENVASSEEQKRKELVEAVDSAETVEERLNVFKKMEESNLFPKPQLDHYCLILANQLKREGYDTEKVVSFYERALRGLVTREIANDRPPCIANSTFSHHPNYPISQVLCLLGSATFELGRCRESLGYYERADEMLRELEKEVNDSCPGNCILGMRQVSQFRLYQVKIFMSRYEDAAVNIRKVVEIREKTMDVGCMEFGWTCKLAYEAYLRKVDIEEALPFCVKALEIYRKHMGCDSVEVGKITRDLGLIYSELEEYEKALELTQLALSVMKKVAPDSHDLPHVEFLNGCNLRDVGRCEEAIEVFSGVVSRAEVKGNDKAKAFSGMAQASFSMGKFDDAKKYMKTAQRIYEKEEMDPRSAALGFADMSTLYEKMNDNETAILLLRRVLAIPKIPQKLLSEASARLFKLVSVVGKEEKAIPYMEDAVEKLKDSFGSKHYEVGRGYSGLGVAYKKSGQPELALKCLTKAIDIMDAYYGPNHLVSLKTSHNLALTYMFMKRFESAIRIEEAVVEGLKGLVPSDQEFLDEAGALLNNLCEMMEMIKLLQI